MTEEEYFEYKVARDEAKDSGEFWRPIITIIILWLAAAMVGFIEVPWADIVSWGFLPMVLLFLIMLSRGNK